jgi:hypothetical protein
MNPPLLNGDKMRTMGTLLHSNCAIQEGTPAPDANGTNETSTSTHPRALSAMKHPTLPSMAGGNLEQSMRLRQAAIIPPNPSPNPEPKVPTRVSQSRDHHPETPLSGCVPAGRGHVPPKPWRTRTRPAEALAKAEMGHKRAKGATRDERASLPSARTLGNPGAAESASKEDMSPRSLGKHGLVPPKLQRRRKRDKMRTMGTSMPSNRAIPVRVAVPNGMPTVRLQTGLQRDKRDNLRLLA